MTTATRSRKSRKPASLPVNKAGLSLLGEIIAWEIPTGTTVRHQELVAALQAAGLDDSAARVLHKRHAFVRACRELAADRLVRNLDEDADSVTFQFTAERKQADRFEYTFEATVTLNKQTGDVTGSDAALATQVKAKLDHCEEVRDVKDITRVIQALFRHQADLFPIKWPVAVYFVPQQHAAFLDKVERFVTALGGRLPRFPVPDGTQQGNQSVSNAVSDALFETLNEYEEAISTISIKTRDATLDSASQKIQAAQWKVKQYSDLLGAHAARLEDHAAYVEKLLRDRAAEVAAAKAQQTKQAS